MEKGRFVIGKKEILAGTIAVATMSSVIGDATTNAQSPYAYKSYPDSNFRPLVIDKSYDSSPPVRIPHSDIIVEFPSSSPAIIESPSPSPKPDTTPKPNWIRDSEISWYGPGFYGNRTACGEKLTNDLIGVANKTLPCGTLVTFEWKGKQITVPVVDRGPYVAGRQWDLTGATCKALSHCFTGPINFRIGK